MLVSYATDFGLVPSQLCADSDDVWERLLSDPQVGPKRGPCIRGAIFVEDANAPTKLNVRCMTAALFDIDEGDVPNFDQIWQALEQHRFIAWTTFSSSPGQRKIRVVVPFARPVWPGDFRYVWHQINAMLRSLADASQDNVDRLGYLPRIDPSREAEARAGYEWTVRGAEDARLDPYARFGVPTGDTLPDGSPRYVFPEAETRALTFSSYDVLDEVPEPDRSDWYDDEQAKNLARTYFRNVGPGIVPGGRHAELFKIGCKLWWDFWLDHDGVHEILSEINRRFPEPKSAYDVMREVEASFARTRGSAAVQQREVDGTPREPGHRRRRPPRASAGEIRQIAEIEKRSADHTRREIGVWMLKLLPKANGVVDAIDRPNVRDQAIRRTARLLGQKLVEHDPEGLAELFADTISACAAQEPWSMTVAQVQTIIESAQAEVIEKREQRRREENEVRRRNIEEATRGERTTEYTPQEVEAFADRDGASVDQWQKRWVIALGPAYYIFVNGEYRYPVDAVHFVNRAVVDLSPVPNLNLYKFNREGDPVPLSASQIIEKYGTVARKGRIDLTAQRSYYDASTETFVEAPCPVRTDIEPERVDVVEDFFNTFPQRDALIAWLSNVPSVDQPLPGLYLKGPKSSGKTLVGHALQRIWQADRSLTYLQSYFDRFNDAILNSPLLVADEFLPKQLTGKGGTEVFRALIVAQSRPLNRKFLKSLSLTGYFRVLLLANNDRMLPAGSGFLNADDSAAFSERLLYIDLEEGPSQFLRRLSLNERDAFVEDDLVAKHVLWLASQRPARSQERFAVSGGVTSVTKRIEFDGARGDVLHWIYNAVMGEGRSDYSMNPISPEEIPIFVDERTGLFHPAVNANFLRSRWKELLGPDARAPSMNWLRDALGTLALHRDRVRLSDNERKRFVVVDAQAVHEWAEWTDCDAEGFYEKLAELAQKATDQDRLQRFESGPQLRVINGGP